MSEYCKPFEKSFICRTNKLIQDYDNKLGELDATVLLNGLLGMLVIPFEKYNEKFRDIDRTSVIRDLFNALQYEKRYNAYGNDYSDFEIIRFMRNAVAHFHVEAIPENGKVKGFRFKAFQRDKYCEHIEDDCRFKSAVVEDGEELFMAELSISEIKELSGYIKDYVLEFVENKKCRNCDYRQ